MYENEEAFYVIVRIAKILGLWRLEDGASRLERILYECYIMLLNSVSVALSASILANVIEERDDVIAMTEDMSKLLVAVNSLCKVLLFTRLRPSIVALISRAETQSASKRPVNLNFIALIFYAPTNVAAVGFIVYSLYRRVMPVGVRVPGLDLGSCANACTWWWYVAFATVTLAYVVGVWRLLAVDLTVVAVLVRACDRLEALAERLRGLEWHEEDVGELEAKLGECVVEHVEIIGQVGTARLIFENIILVQYMAHTLELCLSVIMMNVTIKAGDFQSTMNFIGMIIIVLSNGYFYCHFGNELMIKSENVRHAAYESSWIDWPVSLQKNLIMIIRCARKPLFLSAGKMVPLSLRAYTKITQNAYSIFALLYEKID